MFKWFWTLFSLGAPAPETVPNARHHRKRRKLERKLRVSKFENDYVQYTEQCRLVNVMVKTTKETFFTTIFEISKGDQRSLFLSIDHLLNLKAVPRFPSSSSDLELAEFLRRQNWVHPCACYRWDTACQFKDFFLTMIHMNLEIFDRYRLRKYQILTASKVVISILFLCLSSNLVCLC